MRKATLRHYTPLAGRAAVFAAYLVPLYITGVLLAAKLCLLVLPRVHTGPRPALDYFDAYPYLTHFLIFPLIFIAPLALSAVAAAALTRPLYSHGRWEPKFRRERTGHLVTTLAAVFTVAAGTLYYCQSIDTTAPVSFLTAVAMRTATGNPASPFLWLLLAITLPQLIAQRLRKPKTAGLSQA